MHANHRMNAFIKRTMLCNTARRTKKADNGSHLRIALPSSSWRARSSLCAQFLCNLYLCLSLHCDHSKCISIPFRKQTKKKMKKGTQNGEKGKAQHTFRHPKTCNINAKKISNWKSFCSARSCIRTQLEKQVCRASACAIFRAAAATDKVTVKSSHFQWILLRNCLNLKKSGDLCAWKLY